MKTIVSITRPCDCHVKLRAHERAQKPSFHAGSIVECDCGQLCKLVDDQRDGPHWRAISPRERGVGTSVPPSDTTCGLTDASS